MPKADGITIVVSLAMALLVSGIDTVIIGNTLDDLWQQFGVAMFPL